MKRNARHYGAKSLAKVEKTKFKGYSFMGWEIRPVDLGNRIVYAAIDNNRVVRCVFEKRSLAKTWLIELSRRSAAGFRVNDVIDHLHITGFVHLYPDPVFTSTYAAM